jgi:tight adherence protein C
MASASPVFPLLGALVCLALALRARRIPAAPSPPARPRPPALLALAAAVPLPAPIRRPAARPGTDRRLVEAGVAAVVTVAMMERARAGGAALAVLGSAGLALLQPVLAALVPALVAAAFLAPDLWLVRRAAARRASIARELPDLLDLLVISVEAGMALDPALQLAAERLPGILAAEVQNMLRELGLGTPRRAAYRGLADRLGSPEVAQVVAALLQAEELGAPLSRALAGQAEGLRAARRQRARDRAARAAPRIQLVVALLMVPAALILVMGVLVIELAREVGAVVG